MEQQSYMTAKDVYTGRKRKWLWFWMTTGISTWLTTWYTQPDKQEQVKDSLWFDEQGQELIKKKP